MTIKFSHHTDPRDARRTLTLARDIVTANGVRIIRLGYSINFVPVNGNRDIYDRKHGNLVAAGRVSENPFLIALNEGEDPITKITEFFASAPASTFKRRSHPMTRIKRILGL